MNSVFYSSINESSCVYRGDWKDFGPNATLIGIVCLVINVIYSHNNIKKIDYKWSPSSLLRFSNHYVTGAPHRKCRIVLPGNRTRCEVTTEQASASPPQPSYCLHKFVLDFIIKMWFKFAVVPKLMCSELHIYCHLVVLKEISNVSTYRFSSFFFVMDFLFVCLFVLQVFVWLFWIQL